MDEIKIIYDESADKKSDKEKTKTKKSRLSFQAANITVLCICFISIALFLMFGERPTVSLIEKRDLAEIPKFSLDSFFGGKYTAGISEYYSDTVPYRDFFKEIAADIRSFAGISYDGVIYSGNMNVPDIDNDVANDTPEKDISSPSLNNGSSVPAKTSSQVTHSQSQSSENPRSSAPLSSENPRSSAPLSSENNTLSSEQQPNPDIEEGVMANGVLVFTNLGRSFSCYYGSYNNGRTYAEYLNTYKSELPEVNIYSLVAPTSQTYYMPQKYLDNYGSEPGNIENINSHLNNVTAVDAYNALLSHKDEYIYFKTDHHWAPLGAYYAAHEFAKGAGVTFADLNSYKKIEKKDFVGSFFTFSGRAEIKNSPDDFIYYEPQNSYTTDYYTPSYDFIRRGSLLVEAKGNAMYCTFMGGDAFIVHINTDCKNGRNLMIIKDSYGNALIPFLTNSFENIYVVDMRYFEINSIEFAKDHNITDLLFAMNTFSATGSNFKNIERIRTQ